MGTLTRRHAMAGLLAAAVVVRLTLVAAGGPPETFEYDELARNLLAGRGYGRHHLGDAPFRSFYSGVPYVALTAAMYRLAPGGRTAMLVAQAVVSAGLGLVVVPIARRLMDERFTLIAGALTPSSSWRCATGGPSSRCCSCSRWQAVASSRRGGPLTNDPHRRAGTLREPRELGRDDLLALRADDHPAAAGERGGEVDLRAQKANDLQAAQHGAAKRTPDLVLQRVLRLDIPLVDQGFDRIVRFRHASGSFRGLLGRCGRRL